MKQNHLVVALLIVIAFLSTGCKQDGGPETTNLKLLITTEQFSTSRSLTPSSDTLVISDYHLSGSGPNNQTFSMDCSNTAVNIGNLAIGRWTIEAVAYNAEGTPLVSGSVTTMLSKVTSTATLNLTDLVGTGSFKTLVTWDPDQVADDATLEMVLLDHDENRIDLTLPDLDTVKGEVLIESPLQSGSYLLQLRLYSQGTLVSGATEAIRIVADTTSEGTVSMIIGDLSTEFTISISNNTMLPIQGTITASPATPLAQEEVTLQYTPENLPEGVTMDELEIDWYCEGSIVQEESNIFTSIPKAGSHRYDVVAKHARLGSLGNTTIHVTMPFHR